MALLNMTMMNIFTHHFVHTGLLLFSFLIHKSFFLVQATA